MNFDWYSFDKSTGVVRVRSSAGEEIPRSGFIDWMGTLAYGGEEVAMQLITNVGRALRYSKWR